MKPKNLQRLMALNLRPEALAAVMEILAEETKQATSRREYDRQWRASQRQGLKTTKGDMVEIKFGTPQWEAWERHRGKPIPRGMSMTWQVPSEWPPTNEGNSQTH